MSGATFGTLMGLSERLRLKGHHDLTPWWRDTLEHYYAHPTARTLVARVGRGGAKSHTSVRISLNEVLFGDWQIPPGEVHFWAYASTSISEARQRLRLIERCLADLSIGYDRVGEEIVLRDLPRGWRVFAATIGAVSGFRCFGRSADELAKWTAADGAANPAAEVVASMTAMAISHPGARALLISSPLGTDDYHASRFAIGDTEHQLTVHAPTWTANPSIAEEQTRRDEPDLRVWSREYAAEPQAARLAAFDADHVVQAFEPIGHPGYDHGAFGVIDASSGKKDTWSWLIASWRGEDRAARQLVVSHVDGIGGTFWGQTSGDRVVATVAADMRARGVRVVYGDQRESLMLAAAFSRHGLRFVELPWSGPRKERAVMVVRRWLADGVLMLPQHEKLRAELLAFEERITSSGALTFAGGRGTSGHDDYVALLLTTAMADSEPRKKGLPPLPGSPVSGNRMVEALFAAVRREDDAHSPRAHRAPESPPGWDRMTMRERLEAVAHSGTVGDQHPGGSLDVADVPRSGSVRDQQQRELTDVTVSGTEWWSRQ